MTASAADPGHLVHGRTWPALGALLAATAALYLWGLGASGYANKFYAAAAQAGSRSWTGFFFGSFDAANAITVDKPPAALWPMALSVRLFGLGPWQVLVPQALLGVATVAVLFAGVRRRFGAAAGLIAGGVLATTPVAALMFRFDNPDALLCLLMVCAVCCVLRAVEDAGTTWLVLAGACFGLGFLTKSLQAWLILPPLALLYLVCAPTGPRRRLGQLLVAGLAMVVSAGWWVAVVELWPPSARPYIGGSRGNSFLELTFGYNGLDRLRDEAGGVPGGDGGGRWGGSGAGRLFGDAMGGQVAWLLPAALILLAAGLVLTWRRERTDAQRAAFLAWGGSLLATAATFSLLLGFLYEYYTVALAPYVAALTGMGTVPLWRAARAHAAAAGTLALAVAVTAVWSSVLLDRGDAWLPWLHWAVPLGGGLAAMGLLGLATLPRRLVLAAAATGLAAALAGPLAYTLATVHTPHGGSVPTAGPARPPGAGERGGDPPGLFDGQRVSGRTASVLGADAGSYTWAAAVIGAQNAASYQLATESPVMAVGGFAGTDPSPTLAGFRAQVAQRRIHYFIAPRGPGGAPGGAGRATASRIASWVEQNFTPVAVGGSTLYDLNAPKTGRTQRPPAARHGQGSGIRHENE